MTGAQEVTLMAEAANDAPADLVGRVLRGTYRIIRRLDRGGMSEVFEAEHLRLRRPVAVKILNGHLAANDSASRSLQREAQLIGELAHPHIVQVIDFDLSEQGEPYLVMELLHGETLAARLTRDGALDVAETVRLTLQIASALAAVHGASIVHRDLKPSNVFLVGTPGALPHAKLLDFGISKRLSVGARHTYGELAGTPEYMAPEQVRGLPVDHRTDQYALAAVAYEMFTGRGPFCSEGPWQAMRRILDEPAIPLREAEPGVPAPIARVIESGLAKDADDRHRDIGAFATALAAAHDPLADWISTVENGDARRRVWMVGAPWSGCELSSRAAFLLSRLEDGPTIDDVLETAAMPRPETLRTLLQLVHLGLARLE